MLRSGIGTRGGVAAIVAGLLLLTPQLSAAATAAETATARTTATAPQAAPGGLIFDAERGGPKKSAPKRVEITLKSLKTGKTSTVRVSVGPPSHVLNAKAKGSNTVDWLWAAGERVKVTGIKVVGGKGHWVVKGVRKGEVVEATAHKAGPGSDMPTLLAVVMHKRVAAKVRAQITNTRYLVGRDRMRIRFSVSDNARPVAGKVAVHVHGKCVTPWTPLKKGHAYVTVPFREVPPSAVRLEFRPNDMANYKPVTERVNVIRRSLDASSVEKAAKSLTGYYYRWGGKTGKRLDCSGFTYQVIKRATGGRVQIPTYSIAQRDAGKRVSRAKAAAGDVRHMWAPQSHVQVVLKDGRQASSPEPGRKAYIGKMGDRKSTWIRYYDPVLYWGVHGGA